MTKYEFVVRTSNYGFPCEPLGQGDGIPDATTPKASIMHDGEEWRIYRKNDNDEETLWFVGTEDEAFERFYEILLDEMREWGYLNETITRDILETSRVTLADYIWKNRLCNTWHIHDALDLLTEDFAVLNEFKYYVKTGKFVPKDTCVRRGGYSAEDIFEREKKSVIEAFEELVLRGGKTKANISK